MFKYFLKKKNVNIIVDLKRKMKNFYHITFLLS